MGPSEIQWAAVTHRPSLIDHVLHHAWPLSYTTLPTDGKIDVGREGRWRLAQERARIRATPRRYLDIGPIIPHLVVGVKGTTIHWVDILDWSVLQ